jgi:plastocyanin
MRASTLTLALGTLIATLGGVACSSSSSMPDGGSGAGGSTAAGGAGGGSSPAFVDVAPCDQASAYTTGSTIMFGGNLGLAYSPKCLQVSAGAQVTFEGDFGTHPLTPSAKRGTLTGNPIVDGPADGGASASAMFTFPTAGFFAYFCAVHGPADDGTGMEGVIWVQ